MFQDAPQEAVPLLLQQVLRQVPLRASRNLRQQGNLTLLQQLEDQGRRAQVPLTSLLFFVLFGPAARSINLLGGLWIVGQGLLGFILFSELNQSFH
jgi:hypothetical protein